MSGELGNPTTTIRQSVTIEQAVDLTVDKINLKLVFTFAAMLCTVINTGAWNRIWVPARTDTIKRTLRKNRKKKGGIVGSILSTLSVAACSIAPNHQVLLLLRIISGFGIFVNFTGTYCWAIEFAPTNLRIPISGFVSLGWVVGLFVTITLSYLLNDWQNIFLGLAGVNVLSLLAYFLTPLHESLRFSLIQGKEEEARETLKKLARITDSNVNVDTLDLVFEETKEFTYLNQVKDLKTYPNLLNQTLLGLWAWFAVALISYSSSYGWGKMGGDLFSTYSFSALGEGVAFITSVFVCQLLGRQRATLTYLVIMILMSLLAMLDVNFSPEWSLELVAGLIGYVATTSAFQMMWLVSAELAPTSHRGMILCISSSAARVGSIIGPYANLLYSVTDRRVPLALSAGLSLMSCVAIWFLPDTTNRSIPETPEDVELLARKKKKENLGEVLENKGAPILA
ncbi:organic cation transporter protein-like [Bolinopsis microptera]|uniref:organic cation transporter protein-like n=1 Tax=Bolinopsis microptera TaxID=2820187 RepID=UPI003078AE2A